MTQPKKVIFDFFVYRIFRKRSDNKVMMRAFRVFSSGHLLAKLKIDEFEEEQEVKEMISANELNLYMVCVKRVSHTEVAPQKYDESHFHSEMELNQDQLKFFQENRVL